MNNNIQYQDYSKDETNYKRRETKNNFKLLAIPALILLIFTIVFFMYNNENTKGETKYTELSTKLCNAAEEYKQKRPEIIDSTIPGSTAYITLKKLSDEYLVESKIKDPRTKNEYLPLTTYVRLSVASNGEVYCESVVDTGDDKTPPILTLNGGNELSLLVGTNFEDPGAKAVDDVDGDITSRITRSGNVDVSKAGNYTITYRITDVSGNSSVRERKIHVNEYKDLNPTIAANLDITSPQIEIKGKNPYCINIGSKYEEPGILAIDNVDGNITDKIIVDNKVSGERSGTFRVTYTVEDVSGNKTVAYRSVEVKTNCDSIAEIKNIKPVNTKPIINLIGGSSIIVNLYEEYVDRGANAWDKEDGDLTKYIMVDSSSVNVNIPGIYTVYYEVKDMQGDIATVKRLVTVVNTNAISNVSVAHFLEYPSDIKIAVGNPQIINTPIAVDEKGNKLQVTTIIKGPAGNFIPQIDFYVVGKYTIIYSATPKGGVTQSVSRIVDIYDNSKPILTAPSVITIEKREENCSITTDDLINAGVIATDSSNSRSARIKIKNNSISVCKANTSGENIIIYAEDDYGNKSDDKNIKIIINEKKVTKDVSNVSITNCGTNKEITLNVNATHQLGATVYPIDADDKAIKWNVEEPDPVITVTNGLIKAIKKGSAHVKVITNNGNKTDICYVIVKEATTVVSVTDVIIQGCESGKLTIEKGKSATLIADVKPALATNKEISWISSDTSKVTVVNGVISGVELGSSDVLVKTKDGNKEKKCIITVEEPKTIVDTTPPSKTVVISNTANSSDPYNKNGLWYGGNGKRQIKLIVESNDKESEICKFELIKEDKSIIEFSPTAANKKRGEFVWDTDTNQTIQIRAVNCADLKGSLSDKLIIRLDNTGPSINFTKSMTESEWINSNSYTVKYSATDNGAGLLRYEYTHDDVKALSDPTKATIEGKTSVGEKTFNENAVMNTGAYAKYVYVRAVDKLENKGEWTATPSWLNMDSIPPKPPTLTQSGNNTSKLNITFAYTDERSPKQSGFLKYTYKVNDGEEQTINNINGSIYFTEPKTYKVEAWSYDKAKNKSNTSSTLTGLKVIPELKVICPKNSVKQFENIVCSLDSEKISKYGDLSDVKLECYNNGEFVRSYTTTSSDKTIYCKPPRIGKMTIKASKTGWISTESSAVNVSMDKVNGVWDELLGYLEGCAPREPEKCKAAIDYRINEYKKANLNTIYISLYSSYYHALNTGDVRNDDYNVSWLAQTKIRIDDATYDLVGYAIYKARQEGISPYLWYSPMRYKDFRGIEQKEHPEWRTVYKNGAINEKVIDLANEDAKQYELNLIRSAVTKYKPDGIILEEVYYTHSDESGYPSYSKAFNLKFNDSSYLPDISKSNEANRRKAIMSKVIYDFLVDTKKIVKGINPNIIFAVDGTDEAPGAKGGDNYDTWVKNGVIDYYVPQAYYFKSYSALNNKYNEIINYVGNKNKVNFGVVGKIETSGNLFDGYGLKEQLKFLEINNRVGWVLFHDTWQSGDHKQRVLENLKEITEYQKARIQ